MAQRLLRAYDEIPDGTQCHRKTYITTAFGGLLGKGGPRGRRSGSKGQRARGGRGASRALGRKVQELENLEGSRLVSPLGLQGS